MEFIDEISNVKIIFTKQITQFYSDFMKLNDFKVESGGIIVGCLNPADKQVIITDITTPYPKDRRASNYFKRSEFGHQQEMDRLWKDSKQRKTYLGEWHSHKEAYPIPSCIDRKDWNRIAKLNLNHKQPFFIIVGQKRLKVWTVSNGILREMKEVEGIEKND